MNLNACEQKPIINYPTFWDYKVIFYANINAEKKIEKLLEKKEFKFSFSHSSKNDKYKSYLLSVYVENEKDRLSLFNKLKVEAQFVL